MIEVPAGLVLVKAPFLACRPQAPHHASPDLSSVCIWRARERFLVFLSVLTRTPALLDQGPTLMTSLNLNDLPCLQIQSLWRLGL